MVYQKSLNQMFKTGFLVQIKTIKLYVRVVIRDSFFLVETLVFHIDSKAFWYIQMFLLATV